MEHGFYHPSRGYWQAIDISDDVYVIEVEPERVERDDDGNEVVIPAVTRETTQLAELLATYPAGTVEVPLKPGADHEWQDGAWVHAPPAPEDLRESFPTLNPAQIRLGLLSIGITGAMVESALEDDAEALTEWRYRPSYRRTHPLVIALSSPAHFDLPAEQVDALWLWAAEL